MGKTSKYEMEKVLGFCKAIDMHVKPTDEERRHAVAFINSEIERRNKAGRPRLKKPSKAAMATRRWRAKQNG